MKGEENLSKSIKSLIQSSWNFVGLKAKGWISKRVFKENKARQVPEKRTFLIPWYEHIRVRIRESEMFVFWKIWRALISLNTRFEIHTLLPYYRRYTYYKVGSFPENQEKFLIIYSIWNKEIKIRENITHWITLQFTEQL